MATAQPRHVGQRVSYHGALCTVRYIGPVDGTAGTWLGVEWDDAARGKHDGSHKGVRYFACACLPYSRACLRSSAHGARPRAVADGGVVCAPRAPV